MPAEAGLKANLVAPSRIQLHLDERRVRQPLENAVPAAGRLSRGIARMGVLLDQRPRIPDQLVTPLAGLRRGVAIHHGKIDALGLPLTKLRLETSQCRRSKGEHDEPRGIAVD